MNLDQTSIALGFAAGAVQLLGYVVYNLNPDKINVGSWLIWTFGAVVELVSYFFMTDGDVVAIILPAVCAVACIVTFIIAWVRKRFTRPDKVELGFFGLDVIITLVWIPFLMRVPVLSGAVANLAYQASTGLSFVPMIRGLQRHEEREEPMPWIIWTAAYTLFLTSMLMRIHPNEWLALVYPATGMVTHYLVYRTANFYSNLSFVENE